MELSYDGTSPTAEDALASILSAPTQQLCASTPKCVERNRSFLVDMTSLNPNDIFADDLRASNCQGCSSLFYQVKHNLYGEVQIRPGGKKNKEGLQRKQHTEYTKTMLRIDRRHSVVQTKRI